MAGCGIHCIANAREANIRQGIEEQNNVSNGKDGMEWDEMDGSKPNYRFQMQKKGKCLILFHTVGRIDRTHTFMKNIKVRKSMHPLI